MREVVGFIKFVTVFTVSFPYDKCPLQTYMGSYVTTNINIGNSWALTPNQKFVPLVTMAVHFNRML